MKKRILAYCTALLLCSMSVFAAELPASPVYPAEVNVLEENGISHVEKVYCLKTNDNPASIPTEDFEREGVTYTLLDILKNDQSETEKKQHTEVVTSPSETNDLSEIFKTLTPTLEVVTEDGYSGLLTLDYPSVGVEVTDYTSKVWTVTASRTYPNLSDADVSLFPKEITENGRTLTLSDVSWQETADGHYTAVATYSGKASSKQPTGYTVTASYSGEVEKTTADSVIYTAVFTAGEKTAHNRAASSINWRWVLIPLGIAAVGGLGYGGYKGYKYYQNKKRGYV